MLKNVFKTLIVLLLFYTPAVCQHEQKDSASISEKHAEQLGIDFFSGSFSEALELSKKEGKPIFVDAFVTWSSACTWMENNTFPNEELAKYYNANFICMRINCEKGDGIDFAKRFEIKTYPTLLFIKGDGTVHYSEKGTKTADALTKTGKIVVAQLDSKRYELDIKTTTSPKGKRKIRRRDKHN